MKVQVIGLGVVGKAQAFLCFKLGHEVYGLDINHETSPYVQKLEKPIDADLTFICTPDGAVENVVRRLVEQGIQGLYVIKSTVPLGTTERLMKKYGVHICHNPEFLREKHAFEDVLNPSRIVIGECCEKHGLLLERFYLPLARPIFRTSPLASEAVKLVSNAHLSTLISFWNEIDALCSTLGLNTKEIAKMVCADSRISSYGTTKFGEPFDGKCLPKDLGNILTAFESRGLEPRLLSAVKEVNERLKNVS